MINLESEYGIGPQEEAAIADFFREADHLYMQGKSILHTLILGKYQKEFGDLNFAVLESIFRNNNFGIYFLAIEASQVKSDTPSLTVDPNRYLEGKIVTLPYAAYAYSGVREVHEKARSLGFEYDASINLENLKYAGTILSNPSSALLQIMHRAISSLFSSGFVNDN